MIKQEYHTDLTDRCMCCTTHKIRGNYFSFFLYFIPVFLSKYMNLHLWLGQWYIPEPGSNSINMKSQSGQFSVTRALVRYCYLKNSIDSLEKCQKKASCRKDLVYSPIKHNIHIGYFSVLWNIGTKTGSVNTGNKAGI